MRREDVALDPFSYQFGLPCWILSKLKTWMMLGGSSYLSRALSTTRFTFSVSKGVCSLGTLELKG